MSVLTLQEYEFEKQFNENEAIQWMQENWKKSFLFSALYAAFVFGGRHLMNKRAKFELRKPLVLWSLTLAVFSIFGALRTGAYMVYTVMTKGLKHSVCDQGFYNGPVSKFWAYAFVLSKAPELGTVPQENIFVARKREAPVIKRSEFIYEPRWPASHRLVHILRGHLSILWVS